MPGWVEQPRLAGGIRQAAGSHLPRPVHTGDRPHRNAVGVHARDRASDFLKTDPTRDAFLAAIRGLSLAEASLIGRYARVLLGLSRG